MDLQLALNILAVFTGIGAIIASVGFAYAQFTSGGNKAKDDLIQTLQESAKAEKERAERLATEKLTLDLRYATQINELNEKIGKLQGLYEASEASKKEYLAILQDRDPATQKFMEFMTKAASASNETTEEARKYMADSIRTLGEIRTFMHNLNERAKKAEQFQDSVVVATESGVGKVLRKDG